MRLRFVVLTVLAPALVCVGQTRRALLIGIDLYQPAGTTAQHPPGCAYGRCELGSFENLEGAVNDARSMADLLTSPKFGFPAGQVTLLANPAPKQPPPGVKVLPAAQTDRAGILAAMQRYLVDEARRGDTVVFYDASHGSLRVNSQGNKITVSMNGRLVHADSTLVPADAYKGGFDVRDREMTRIFQAALDKGVHLTVIFDSCHSGGATRGAASGLVRARTLPYDPRDANEAPEVLASGRLRPAPTERTDNPALVFSAAQQDQEADEAEPTAAQPEAHGAFTAAQPEAHGAFTAALLEALEALPADVPAAVVYQRVKAVLEGNSLTSQEPDLDATAARRQQPLFGGSAADAKTVRAAALRSEADGRVWLDVGRVAGVGVGSEFVSTSKGADEQAVRLRVTELQGIARSTARVVSPAAATVASGEVFELSRWVPAEAAGLRFWHWPANLSQAEIASAAAAIEAAGVALVGDPAEERWTDRLGWNGVEWRLEHAEAHTETHAGATIDLDPKRRAPVGLGAKLTAGALREHLAAGARLWVNLPPSRELAAGLTLHEKGSAVEEAANLEDANYVLAGTIGADGPAYAWMHQQEFDGGPAATAGEHSAGCSATSQYPVRSDWVAGTDPAASGAAAMLNGYAARLAKVHGWLELADSPGGASTANYYRLAIVHAEDQIGLAAGEAAAEGTPLQLALTSDAPVTERRWVYVLDIDCHGKGTLLYPRDLTENQFPSEADTGRSFVLPGAPVLRIAPPFGVDTLVMLSTAQPLPDAFALEFEGVATRGGGAGSSPLERLLVDTSRGTRGEPAAVPTNWGIELTTLRSVPKGAAK